MVAFFSTLLRLFFQVFRSRRTILSEIALLKKENEILLRKMGKKKVHFGFYDKLFLVVLNRAADIKRQLTLVKPETILSWQRNLIKRFWTFELSLFKIPSGPEPHHESFDLPAGATRSEHTGRRPTRKSHLVQNAAHVSVVFMSWPLPSITGRMMCNRHCNQAVMELCNSMHLVDKNLEIVPCFRRIEG